MSLTFSGALTVSGGIYAVPVFAKTASSIQSFEENTKGTSPEETGPVEPASSDHPDNGHPDNGSEGSPTPDEKDNPENGTPSGGDDTSSGEDDTTSNEEQPSNQDETSPDEEQTDEKVPEHELPKLHFAPGPFPKEPQVGGFVIEVNSLQGYNLTMGKVNGETSEKGSEPQAKIGLENVTLRGLNLYKNLTTSDGTRFHIQITTRNPSDEVKITGTTPFYRDLETQVSELYAKEMTARVLGLLPITLRNFWDTEPEKNLLIFLGSLLDLGARLDAEQLKLNTHRLQAKKIVIPNLVLTVGEGHLSSRVQ
jgi:hypothetical protein